ncbi:MAG TPA: hypothetical protein VLX92_04700 [Kofleriaceae bacterium]|nr:hypothetical protein [Kofleriaceae bacterium]
MRILALALVAGCGGSHAAPDAAPTPDAALDAAPDAIDAAPPGAITCNMPGNAGSAATCDYVLYPNSTYALGSGSGSNNDLPAFTPPTNATPRGDADPCIRTEPSGSTLYMTYTLAQGGPLDTELAYSSDGGAHWSYAGAIWPGTPSVADPYTGTGTGVINSETSNLAFRTLASGGEVVYGIHSVYWSDASGQDHHTARLAITESALPASPTPAQIHAALAAATEGNANVASIMGYKETAVPTTGLVDLWTAGNAQGNVDDCIWFHEPSLYWQDSDQTLYLLVQCESATDQRIVVFGTPTPGTESTPDAAAWSWSYAGAFLHASDAVDTALAYDLPAVAAESPYFTQGDIATARDGSLVYLASLVHLDAMEEVRSGIVIASIGQLTAPSALTASTTMTAGAPPYRDFLELELQNVDGGDDMKGPGSSTYDPGLAIGVVYAGRTYPGLPGVTGFETELFSFPGVSP